MKQTMQKVVKLPLSIVRELQMLGRSPIRVGAKAGRTVLKRTRNTGRKIVKTTRNTGRKIKKVTKPVFNLTSNVFGAALFGLPRVMHKQLLSHTRGTRVKKTKRRSPLLRSA